MLWKMCLSTRQPIFMPTTISESFIALRYDAVMSPWCLCTHVFGDVQFSFQGDLYHKGSMQEDAYLGCLLFLFIFLYLIKYQTGTRRKTPNGTETHSRENACPWGIRLNIWETFYSFCRDCIYAQMLFLHLIYVVAFPLFLSYIILNFEECTDCHILSRSVTKLPPCLLRTHLSLDKWKHWNKKNKTL